MKKIVVLMSTYNGEKYLKEQLDSILNQKCRYKIDILIRDDNSSDNTTKILKEYEKYKNIKWYSGENIKPARSFLDLLSKCGKYDYYAFSDQDDVWDEIKLEKALEVLDKKEDKYDLYFSNKKITDKDLNYISEGEKNLLVSFETSIIRNIATGCTMVFNNSLKEKIKKPKYLIMHDSYIYRVCMLLNCSAYYDNNSYINYRQHSANVIGYNEQGLSLIKRRIKSFLNCKHERKNLAIELLRLYNDEMDNEKKEFLQKIGASNKWKNKVWLLKNKKIKTESKEKNIIFKIALLLGKI